MRCPDTPRAGLHALLCGLLLLTGCGGGKDRHMRLDPPLDGLRAQPAPVLAGTLQVQNFSARGLLGEPRLVWIDPAHPGELVQAQTLLWEETPARALALATATRLEAARIAGVVLPPDQASEAEWRLAGRIERFELAQGSGGGQDRALVAASFILTAGPSRRVVLLAGFCAAEPFPAKDPPAPAFSRAAARLLAQLEAAIAGLPPGMATTAAAPRRLGQAGFGRGRDCGDG